MIKCPHCGSTAQVKPNGNPIISRVSKFLVEGFYCGCGCEWEVEYERNENGYWKDGICSLYSEEENWADPP